MKVSYSQNEATNQPLTDLFETFLDFRDEFIDIIDYFNPIRAEQMGNGNDLMREVVDVIKRMNEFRPPLYHV